VKRQIAADKVAPVGGQRRRRRRSNSLIAAGVAVAIVAGLGGASYFGYVNLKGRVDRLQAQLTTTLQAGQRELEAGKASLQTANTKHDASLVADAVAHFAAAKTQFQAARQTADNSKLLRYLENMPAAGSLAHSRHVAINGIADMGVAISDAGQGLANLDALLIKPPASGQGGRNLLTVLGQAKTGLVTIRADLQRAEHAAAQVDVSVLPAGQQPTFTKAASTISSALSGLDEFGRLVPVLEEILGGNGTRTYLIEQVNPAELRAGGGFIGTYSLLQADHGQLSVIKSGDAYDLVDPRPQPGQNGFIPQPSPLREVIPSVSWSFVDSNIYPDFPSNAKAALDFIKPRIGTKIDAVIAMDYYTVAKMLELTGPFVVPGYGLTVDGANFISQMVQREIVGDPLHKSILSALAGPLMQRVSTLPPDQWPALIAAFNSLAAQRHLQAFFSNATVQDEMSRVGWSGAVNPNREQNYLMEVESNYSGNKVNYALSRHYGLVLTRAGRLLHHKLTITLVNPTPGGSYDRTYYNADIRLFVSAKATVPTSNLTPVKYPNPAPPVGIKMSDGWMKVECCGSQGQVVFQWDTVWPVTDRGNARIYWQKQPGTGIDRIDVTWNDGSGHTYTTKGDLSQDRTITLMPSGAALAAGQPAQGTLPTLSLG
jgi:hypothetical protein